MAMGLSEEDAHCAVRFSLSRYTSGNDLAATLNALEEVLRASRTMVRFAPCR